MKTMNIKSLKNSNPLLSRVFAPLRIFRLRRAASDLRQAHATHRASSLFAPTFKNTKWTR
jgi:hypothetical protein